MEHLHEAEHEQRVQDIITGVAEAFEFSDAKDFLMVGRMEELTVYLAPSLGYPGPLGLQ